MSKNNSRNLSPEEIDQLLGTKDERIYREPTTEEIQHILHQLQSLQKEHIRNNRLDIADHVSVLLKKIKQNEMKPKVCLEGHRLHVELLEKEEEDKSLRFHTWSFYLDVERKLT